MDFIKKPNRDPDYTLGPVGLYFKEMVMALGESVTPIRVVEDVKHPCIEWRTDAGKWLPYSAKAYEFYKDWSFEHVVLGREL